MLIARAIDPTSTQLGGTTHERQERPQVVSPRVPATAASSAVVGAGHPRTRSDVYDRSTPCHSMSRRHHPLDLYVTLVVAARASRAPSLVHRHGRGHPRRAPHPGARPVRSLRAGRRAGPAQGPHPRVRGRGHHVDLLRARPAARRRPRRRASPAWSARASSPTSINGKPVQKIAFNAAQYSRLGVAPPRSCWSR